MKAVSRGVRGGLGSNCGHLKQKRTECETGHICLELKAIGAVVPGCLDSGFDLGPQFVVPEAEKQTQNNAWRHGMKRWKQQRYWPPFLGID